MTTGDVGRGLQSGSLRHTPHARAPQSPGPVSPVLKVAHAAGVGVVAPIVFMTAPLDPRQRRGAHAARFLPYGPTCGAAAQSNQNGCARFKKTFRSKAHPCRTVVQHLPVIVSGKIEMTANDRSAIIVSGVATLFHGFYSFPLGPKSVGSVMENVGRAVYPGQSAWSLAYGVRGVGGFFMSVLKIGMRCLAGNPPNELFFTAIRLEKGRRDGQTGGSGGSAHFQGLRMPAGAERCPLKRSLRDGT